MKESCDIPYAHRVIGTIEAIKLNIWIVSDKKWLIGTSYGMRAFVPEIELMKLSQYILCR